MKNRRGMAVAAAFLAAAALTVGFFLPDLAGRAADQKLSVQAETFAIGKVPSAADARLVDMLKLAATYENELYLDHGAVSDEGRYKNKCRRHNKPSVRVRDDGQN